MNRRDNYVDVPLIYFLMGATFWFSYVFVNVILIVIIRNGIFTSFPEPGFLCPVRGNYADVILITTAIKENAFNFLEFVNITFTELIER
ncbi:hypothetical protein SAMN05216563_102490 [Phytobacter palmae]|nr:hypothetical protein SAMN05216563_102490 [Phytobacter palmae]